MKSCISKFSIFLFVLVFISNLVLNAQQKITTPKEYFGFEMGEDYKLARWDKIVDYFYLLEKQSDKKKYGILENLQKAIRFF